MPAAAERTAPRRGRVLAALLEPRPATLLAVFMALYFGVSLLLSVLRLLEFRTSNWDLGIFQQALWSTSHGRVFYEAGDWEMFGVASYLQVHPALVLYTIVPLYAVAPSPVTLLVVQSAVVALAAVPLFGIARRVLGRDARALAVAGLYLAFAPVLTSNLFDFHMEAFLPLEIILLFDLWHRRRYAWGAVVAGIAFVTIEVTPFLVAALALFFLLEELRPSLPGPVGEPGETVPARAPGALGALRRIVATRRGRWSLALFVGALGAYGVLRLFEWFLLPMWIGAPPNPPAAGSGVAVLGATGLGIELAFGSNLVAKLEYWTLLFALLGFLPLLVPRFLVLSLPWFAFCMQASKVSWSILGYQYGFVAVAPLVIALPFGFVRFEEDFLPKVRAAWERRRAAGLGPAVPAPLARFGRRVGRRRGIWIAGILLVALNLALTPLNPAEQRLNGSKSSFMVSYHPQPGYAEIVEMAGFIPAGAAILASTELFPLVANDLNAYSMLWTATQPAFLPFDAKSPPTWVFLAATEDFAVPTWLWPLLANTSVYGLVVSTWNGPVGAAYLFELGYTGPAQYLCTPSAIPATAGNGASLEGSFGLPTPPPNC